MPQKTNRKKTYTKMVIRQSLLELLVDKPLRSITVKELCTLADINRGTFYKHYLDLYDLAEKIQAEIVTDISDQLTFENMNTIDHTQTYLDLIEYMKNTPALTSSLFFNESTNQTFQVISDRIFRNIYPVMRNQYPNLDDSDIAYIHAYEFSGFMTLIKKWFENGMKESPDEIVYLINGLQQHKKFPLKKYTTRHR